MVNLHTIRLLLVAAAIELATGVSLYAVPQEFGSAIYAPVLPYFPHLSAALMAGGLLLLLMVRYAPPLAIQRILAIGAAAPVLFLAWSITRAGGYTGATAYLFLVLAIIAATWLPGAGALLHAHPVLGDLRRRGPEQIGDPEEVWSARTERALESWSWLLMLLVVTVTSFSPEVVAASLPAALLFVLILATYNIVAGWLLPPLGSATTRILVHLSVLALAIGVLLAGASPVASSLLPLLLAIPMLAARTGGRLPGYFMLAAVLAVLLLSSLVELWLAHRSPYETLTNLAIELVTLGATGAVGVAAAVWQRQMNRQFEQSRRELATFNEKLQAANEELQAQSEELAAQQDELVNQHSKLISQAQLLAAQRDEIQESETRFRTAFEHAPIGMAMVGLDLMILKANRALGEMLGYAPEELVGRSIGSITHPDDDSDYGAKFSAALAEGTDAYHLEKWYRHRDGHAVWVTISVAIVRDAQGLPLHLISQMLDVTENRRTEQQLRHMANYDPLTDLINRRRFEHEVEAELAQSARTGHRGAILFLDFDQFKFVNDTLGHRAGDDLLKSLARVLASTLDQRASVARLGGDEFAILVRQVDCAQAESVAAEILSAVRFHMEVVDGHPVGMTVSIGIALYPEHGRTVEEVMLHADLAMYQAKESGRNRYRIYATGDREAEMSSRLNWERRIREALDEDRFILHFQPIMELQSGEVFQYEALLRLVERDGTLISPRRFLGVAESYGLIHAIDRWVVRRAIRTIAEERRKRRRIALGVNLSARAFSDSQLLPLIQQELLEQDVRPEAIRFEITETAAVAEMEPARAFMATLSRLGCQFALDDFGAGFSSLVYLKQLPVSCLKIDGSFIERLPQEPVDQKMVKAVVTLARELGMKTVAEYVTCAESLSLLRELGVDAAQGFHVGRPAPLPE